MDEAGTNMGLTGGACSVPGLVFVHGHPITLKTQGQTKNEGALQHHSAQSRVLIPAHCWS